MVKLGEPVLETAPLSLVDAEAEAPGDTVAPPVGVSAAVLVGCPVGSDEGKDEGE